MSVYRTALLDPPWRYPGPGWKGGADKEYDTLPAEAIQSFPIDAVLGGDAHLWMWATDTHYETAVEIADSWGFKKRATFIWVKLCKNPLNLNTKRDHKREAKARCEGRPVIRYNGKLYLEAWGNGYYGRSCWEALILFSRGENLLDGPQQVRKSFYAPLQEHSAKPPESLELVRNYSPRVRLECFARERAPGFEAWGAEVGDWNHTEELRPLYTWSERVRKKYQSKK